MEKAEEVWKFYEESKSKLEKESDEELESIKGKTITQKKKEKDVTIHFSHFFKDKSKDYSKFIYTLEKKELIVFVQKSMEKKLEKQMEVSGKNFKWGIGINFDIKIDIGDLVKQGIKALEQVPIKPGSIFLVMDDGKDDILQFRYEQNDFVNFGMKYLPKGIFTKFLCGVGDKMQKI